ncbi:MAG: VanZ family protein [Candidatus Rokubacteria bacterium]|nr:VanZ family protein [Candidatus Rokubacteria bacterium]
MGDPGRPAERGVRPARLVLLAYCVFVVYGSFFPFNFTTDPALIGAQASKIVLHLFDVGGKRAFSIPDLASNVLLGLPVGLLLVAGRMVGGSLPARLAGVALLEAMFAAAVEAGQVFTPGRTASAVDAGAQVAGALAGAVAGLVLLGARSEALGRRVAGIMRRSPGIILVAVIALALAAESLYPYAVTLDVSTGWGNLKRGQWAPLASFTRHFWGDLVVERGLSYAALAVAARSALRPAASGRAGAWIWLLASGLAVGLEGATLLVVGRSPNLDHVILGSAGALLGAVVVEPLARAGWVRAHAPALLIVAAASLLIYEELTPFDFVLSPGTLQAKLRRVDWIPLGAYFFASSQGALFDLGKKALLGGFLGAALGAGGRRAPWAWTLGLGVLLEAAQLLELSHVPSTTDALTLAAGAAAGAALLARYRQRPAALPAHAHPVSD